ncbi:COX15/CtaA family protein [Candidatus Spongiihabitans sp.]|uniref:COX15/CtaA family protein n=1 Tax=Candidatus Spongiihabitans sp. TaxID=3101308 RepID=UPI003C7C596B
MTNQTRTMVIVWLAVCCALVFIMVLLGGAVRLTGSGLSMVDWKPIMGVFPPLSEIAWTRVFEQYQQFPEFKIVNAQISLEKFKFIYLMEYTHRMLGRLIGLVFFLPFIYFVIAKKLSVALMPKLEPKLWLLLTMGVIQGGVGWYMVKSGLVDNPRVSPYRLVLHLLIAVLIYAYMLRVLAGLLPIRRTNPPRAQKFGIAVVGVILLMIASGGFVAGTHAGLIYNTFPTMGGEWIPTEMGALTPMWLNLFENPVAIQFTHRAMAMLVLSLVVIYALMLMGGNQKVHSVLIGIGLLIAVVFQVGLGVVTLVSGVPPVLGVAHQAGALILLTIAVISVSLPALVNDDTGA